MGQRITFTHISHEKNDSGGVRGSARGSEDGNFDINDIISPTSLANKESL